MEGDEVESLLFIVCENERDDILIDVDLINGKSFTLIDLEKVDRIPTELNLAHILNPERSIGGAIILDIIMTIKQKSERNLPPSVIDRMNATRGKSE